METELFIIDNDLNIVKCKNKEIDSLSFSNTFTCYQNAFESLCKKHDWTFEMSDDHSVWEKGIKTLNAINKSMNVNDFLREDLLDIIAKYKVNLPKL